MHPQRPPERGIGTIEVVLVLALLIVILLAAVPQLSDLFERMRF